MDMGGVMCFARPGGAEGEGAVETEWEWIVGVGRGWREGLEMMMWGGRGRRRGSIQSIGLRSREGPR